MTRVVLDTNVLVSAALKAGGAESSVMNLAAANRITLCLSEPILAEYREVLLRPRFALDRDHVENLLRSVASAGVIVQPEHTLSACPDEADNRFLECAQAARAGYLITGNRRHFPRSWTGTQVVNAREFLRIISAGAIRASG